MVEKKREKKSKKNAHLRGPRRSCTTCPCRTARAPCTSSSRRRCARRCRCCGTWRAGTRARRRRRRRPRRRGGLRGGGQGRGKRSQRRQWRRRKERRCPWPRGPGQQQRRGGGTPRAGEERVEKGGKRKEERTTKKGEASCFFSWSRLKGAAVSLLLAAVVAFFEIELPLACSLLCSMFSSTL